MKYEHARQILKKHRDRLLEEAEYSHFISVEKEGENFFINVFATQKHTSHSKVKKQKLKLEDTDTESLEVRVSISKPIMAYALRTDKWRPAPGGVSIGHYAITAGTLGCTVYKNGTKYILSNNHILANCNDGEIEDAIYQPGPHDGGTIDDKIGELYQFVTLVFNDKESPNTVDCALCLPDLATDVADEIIDLEYPTAIEAPTIGHTVVKSGRTTGIMEGTLFGIGDGWVNYGSPGLAWFEDQLLITNISAGGDSGSLVIDKDNGTAVGLLFAGSDTMTIANKMTEVESELGITLLNQVLVDNEAVVNLSCSVVSDAVAAKAIADEAVVDLSASVAVEVYTGKPIANEAVVNLSASCLLTKITPVVMTCSAIVELSALTTNYGYAHYGPNDLAGRYRIADDSLERYELYRGQDAEPDFDADPWETFETLPHTSDVVMDIDLRPNCVALYKMNDNADNPYVAGLSGTPIDLVKGGKFDTGANWDTEGTNWTIAGGKATISSGLDILKPEPADDITPVIGKKYAVIYTITDYNLYGIYFNLGGVSGAQRTAVGTYREVITAVNTNGLKFYPYVFSPLSIDNVTVICVDDFPLAGVLFDEADNFTSDHSVAGKVNKALHFDGINDKIIVADGGVLNFTTQPFSIVICMRRNRSGVIEFLLSRGLYLSEGWILYFHTANRIQFRTYAPGVYDRLLSTDTITDTNWHQIIVIKDGANSKLFLDNTECVYTVGPPLDNPASSTTALKIGCDDDEINKFQGDIDVIGFIDKALTAAERDFLWNDGDYRESLVEALTYHFATRKRNKFNLVSQNIDSWDMEVNEEGDVIYNPAAPQKISITPAAGAKGLVRAQYLYDPNLSNTATKWLIYFTDDGTDPDPASDTPVEVAMYKANGIAHLNWLSPAADNEATLKVLVRTRVTIDGTDYDSQNTTIYSCTANDQGPAAPTGRVFFDKASEAM